MPHKDLKKSKSNCLDCALHKNSICHWFEKPKAIPNNVISKGCKWWRSRLAQILIDKYDAEVCYGRYDKTGIFRNKERR